MIDDATSCQQLITLTYARGQRNVAIRTAVAYNRSCRNDSGAYVLQQIAQLTQRGRAHSVSLKFCEVTQGHSRSFVE